MEIAFEAFSLITATIALALLAGTRLRPAIVTLYICIGFNVVEILVRRTYLKVKATAESATIETVTVALVATALFYALRSRREANRSTSASLSLARICTVWAVTIFALELLLGFILRRWGNL
jgi:EamA domain-containing membrane protein RarD